MRSVLALALFLIGSQSAAADDFSRYTTAALAKLTHAGHCGQKTASWWCIATGWSTGTAAPLPTDKHLLGRAVYVLDSTVEDDNGRLFGLVATIDGIDAKVTASDLPVDSDESTDHAIAEVKRVLEGKAKVARISDRILKRLADGIAVEPVTKTAGEWRWPTSTDPWGNGGGAMRKVGAFWIVVYAAQPATRYYPAGRHVVIFTDAWE